MAVMIPAKPIEVPEGSREDEMFVALSNLPDDYYVFHSFVLITNTEGILRESESRCPKDTGKCSMPFL